MKLTSNPKELTALLNRPDKQHAILTIAHAEAFGLGTRKCKIVSIEM